MCTMDIEDMKTNLETHLREDKLLQSMFPNKGELVFDDPSILDDVRQFIDGIREARTNYISFTINLPNVDKDSEV